MLFGQSVFQSVLDRLKSEDEEAEEYPAHSTARVHGFNTGLAFDVMEGVSASAARPGQAYFDNLETEEPRAAPPPEAAAEPEPAPPPPPEPEPEPVIPERLTRILPQEIATEIAISSRDTLKSLGEKRRAFAKANHPDGVAPAFRANATKRMMIANLLIDEAIRRLSRLRS
ncbi:hypothetical protein ASE04_12415 [Rhizobium sp. Root708]|uniref:hypothetical protein n=1 Tax=Rhizobium sp. Root708 TaxID=1736592 RepID=UPI0006F87A45|nr:hypothetical protein [Rhizobium sp. Root708]KRB50727.1 hypothetical protein ASE04_12415 [Rhizobium sp. Root708]